MLNGMADGEHSREHRTHFHWSGIYVCLRARLPVLAAKSTIPPSEILLTQTAHWTFNEMPFSIINRLTNIIDYDFMLIMDSHQIDALFDLQSDVYGFFSTFVRIMRIALRCLRCFLPVECLVGILLGNFRWFVIHTGRATPAEQTERKDDDDTHGRMKDASEQVEMCKKTDKAYDIII